jgi:hypothetical protein
LACSEHRFSSPISASKLEVSSCCDLMTIEVPINLVVNNLTKLGIAEPAQVLAQYEPQLQAQHKADPANIRTLDVLAFLYSSTGSKDKLATVDLHGWKVLHQQKYAESYMLGKSPQMRNMAASWSRRWPNSRIARGSAAWR